MKNIRLLLYWRKRIETGDEVMKKYADTHSEHGMALIVTLLILAVLSIMAVTLVSNMTLDQKVSSNLKQDSVSKFITLAGYNHALAVLREDLDFINSSATFEEYDWNSQDSSSDDWKTVFSGSDVDIADTISRSTGQVASDTADARWIYLHVDPDDGNSPLIGRYAVLVEDENAKLNINMIGAGYDAVEAAQEGQSAEQVDLEDLFESIGSVSTSLAGDIVTSSQKPYAELEGLYKIAGIDQTVFQTISPYVTICSYDHGLYYDGAHSTAGYFPQINMQYETRINALESVFDKLWNNPVKTDLAVASLLDYRDNDHVPCKFSESDFNRDINGNGSISSSTFVYGVEGIQMNEILTKASMFIRPNDAALMTMASGNFVVSASYAQGTSVDSANMATAIFQIPWDNGVFKVEVFTSAEVPSDTMRCKVEGDGYYDIAAGGNRVWQITVTDGTITIEVEDPLQLDGTGNPDPTQIPSKFEKIKVTAGDFIEIVNISQQTITITPNWTFVCDNGTPADPSDDRSYHITADVTLNGATKITATDPVRVTYDYLILTNSEKAVDIMYGSTVDGTWDGSATLMVLEDSSNSPTFSLLDSDDESVTVKDAGGKIVDHIAASDPNDFCVDGYNPGGGLSTNISREKRSPDYDLTVDGVAVWADSSTAGTGFAGAFGTPGAANSTADSYVIVRDSSIVNVRFLYDMPKNEFQNNPNNALSGATTYISTLGDSIGFCSFDTNGTNFYRKSLWTLTTNGSKSYLALTSSVTSGAKVTFTGDSSSLDMPDGEYRVFLEGLNAGEIHNIQGRHIDTVGEAPIAEEISATLNQQGWTCINGTFSDNSDYLLPFSASQRLINITDNCNSSTPVTENTMYRVVFQPAGFTPLLPGKINVNTADVYTLQTLPGMSAGVAQNIVTYSISTPCTSVSDLINVPGMTFSQYCKIVNLVTVRSSSFQLTVLGQSIRDVNQDGSFDAGDVVLGQKKCIASVYRVVKKDETETPERIKIYTNSFLWEK